MTSDVQLMLIADIADVLRERTDLPAGYRSRPIVDADRAMLADVYRAAYATDQPAAAHELEITFAGEYGVLDLASSPAVVHDDEICAAVMTVHAAPWPGSPPGPFVIEVMTRPEHRRRGLAQHAMGQAAETLAASGEATMALFVMAENIGARRLYETLGFRTWEQPKPVNG